MRKTKNLSRVLSMILAFCLSVALLPAQAFAATTDDDPATWPAPDSHYTAPDKNPVYLMVDFTDEDNGGVAAAHRCLSGAELNPDIVKATASAGGRVKYTCDTCGSWAQINVPALTLSAFTLDPAYLSATTTGVEYSGNAYTVVYNVAPAFHRYVGTTLDNHVSVTAPGSYGIIITVEIIIRNHGNSDSFPSSGVAVTIPARREAPKVEVDSKAQTVSSDKGVEFSADGGKTWTALSKPLNTADYLGKTVLFRYPATREDFASRTVTVMISKHPGAPVLVFDPDNETLNTTPDMEYSTDGGKTWKPCPNPLDVSDLAGKNVLIRYPGKGDGLPGETVTVKIPDRRKAPNVGHTDETRQGRNDGTFTKTDKTMEYRLLPDGKWTAIAGNTVRGLAPGSYEVRYAATASEMASQVQKVTIAKGGSAGGVGDLTTPGSKLSLLNRKDHIAYIAGRTTTQAAPNADITRAEVAAILYRLLTPEAKAAYGTNINRFKDVPAGAWYGTAVSTLCNMGVITGYQDGTFGPQRNITRAELATILARFCDTSGSAAVLDRFTDISHSWARKYINLAAEAGLVYGYTDGTFRPDQNITRAETIVMVNRILGRSANADTVVKGYKTFSDVPTGAWYYWDIVEASNGHSFSMDGSTERWTALG